MARLEKFWDRHAEGYAKRPIADEAAYQKKLQVTRDYFRPDMEVLELGCGTGSTAILHAAHVTHIHVVDISSKMLDIARRKAEAEGITNITFERAAIDDFSAPDGTYDAVLALSVLHLMESKEAVIAKVHRLLKPGGFFASSTMCIGETMAYLKPVLWAGRLVGLLPLVRFLTVDELARSITDAGFAIEHQWQPAKGKAVFIVAKKAP